MSDRATMKTLRQLRNRWKVPTRTRAAGTDRSIRPANCVGTMNRKTGRNRASKPQFPDLGQWGKCESVNQLRGNGGGKFELESERTIRGHITFEKLLGHSCKNVQWAFLKLRIEATAREKDLSVVCR